MKRLLLLALVPLLLAVACNGDPDEGVPPGQTPSPTATPNGTPDATATPDGTPTGTPTPIGADAPVCLQEVDGAEFTTDGDIDVNAGDEGDAGRVDELRWEDYGDCERFVIALGEAVGFEGDPVEAGEAGDVSVEFLRDLGVIRVHLGQVTEVDPDHTDTDTDGALTRAAFVVREPGEDRSLFVDLHVGAPVEARAFVLDSPARVVIDLRPGGEPIVTTATIGDLVVVLEPQPGEGSYPIQVTGYSRHFEANNIARIYVGDEMAEETFTTGSDWTEAWGYFEIEVEEGPDGGIELFVGEDSARDGTEQGVRIGLDMS